MRVGSCQLGRGYAKYATACPLGYGSLHGLVTYLRLLVKRAFACKSPVVQVSCNVFVDASGGECRTRGNAPSVGIGSMQFVTLCEQAFPEAGWSTASCTWGMTFPCVLAEHGVRGASGRRQRASQARAWRKVERGANPLACEVVKVPNVSCWGPSDKQVHCVALVWCMAN